MTVIAMGVHVVDVLARPIEEIPRGPGRPAGRRDPHHRRGLRRGDRGDAGQARRRGAQRRARSAPTRSATCCSTCSARHGIDTGLLVRRTDVQTSASVLPIRPDGSRPAFHVVGANAHYTADDAAVGRHRRGDAPPPRRPRVHGRRGGGEDPLLRPRARRRDLGRPAGPRRAGRRILDWIAPALEHLDHLLPNDEQVLGFTGADDLERRLPRAARPRRRLRRRHGAAPTARSWSTPAGSSGSRRTPSTSSTRPAAATPSPPATCAGSRSDAAGRDAAVLGCAAAALVAQGLGTDHGASTSPPPTRSPRGRRRGDPGAQRRAAPTRPRRRWRRLGGMRLPFRRARRPRRPRSPPSPPCRRSSPRRPRPRPRGAAPARTAAQAARTSLGAVADDYASRGVSRRRGARARRLRIDGRPRAVAHLRFDLRRLAGRRITGAVLRVSPARDLAPRLRGPRAPRAGPALGPRAPRALDAHRRPAPRRRGPVATPDAVDAQPARARDRQPGGPPAPPAARGEQHAAGPRPEGSPAPAPAPAAAAAPGRRGPRRRGRRRPSAVGLGEERGDRRRGGEGRPHPRAGRLPVPVGDDGGLQRLLRPGLGAARPQDVPGPRPDARPGLARRRPAPLLQRRRRARLPVARRPQAADAVLLRPRGVALRRAARRVRAGERMQPGRDHRVAQGRPRRPPQPVHRRLLASAVLREHHDAARPPSTRSGPGSTCSTPTTSTWC